MSFLGIDLGGTKLSSAVFTEEGDVLIKEVIPINSLSGSAVGSIITSQINKLINLEKLKTDSIKSIGISVPGIYNSKTGTAWVPNISGWEDYPLLKEVEAITGNIPVTIDSDRACYILGEVWKGNAQGCIDAVFLAVGTGIGAGILANGVVLKGAHNIAGAIGWTTLARPFQNKYASFGCFEYFASGDGIARSAREYLKKLPDYDGELRKLSPEKITSHEVFAAYKNGDKVAGLVIQFCIEFWGRAVANLISLLDPEKIIIGGGVFGPAKELIPAIRTEAEKWAQPLSFKLVSIETSALDGDAGVFGAGYLALQNLNSK